MPEIVHVLLAVDRETGKVDRSAPMMVWGEGPNHRPDAYDPNPAVLQQFGQQEAGGRFAAEWDGTRWQIGKRIQAHLSCPAKTPGRSMVRSPRVAYGSDMTTFVKIIPR